MPMSSTGSSPSRQSPPSPSRLTLGPHPPRYAPVAMPAITLSTQPYVMHGFVMGLPLPALLGRVQVTLPAGADLARLDACFAQHLPGAPAGPAGCDARSLVQRVLFWVVEMQRLARIAVAPDVRVVRCGTQALFETFDVALPVVSHNIAADLLRGVIQIANQILASTGEEGTADMQAANERVAQTLADLRPFAEPGVNQFHLLQAAFRLGMPVTRLAGRKLRLGTGVHMRLMESSKSDRSSAMGVAIARDKVLTAQVLRDIGLPAPVHRLAADADEAVAAAQALGYPVVVKPADRDQGRGVTANLRNEAEVRRAWTAAREASSRVLVEKHFDGFGYRITVLEGEVIAVLKRRPGGVTGDGEHDVRALIAKQLLRPDVQRARNQGRVNLDEEALDLLAEQGLAADAVPAAGRFVTLRRRDNLSAGGTHEHMPPAQAHPDNLRLAQRAAKALYLDIAGIDLLSPDICRSWRETGALICEVNAIPQFAAGPSGTLQEQVLLSLLGPNPRIPVHLLLYRSPPGEAEIGAAQALQQRLGLQALSCSKQVVIGGELHASDLAHDIAAARAALFNRECESLLMVLTTTELLQYGLPVDRVDGVHVAWGADADPTSRRRLEQALLLTGFARQKVVFEPESA